MAISALAKEQGRHGAKVGFSLSDYNSANVTPAYVGQSLAHTTDQGLL